MLKSFRYLFLPFSLIYGGIIGIRNWLFNKNYLKSSTFNFPIICVGNLAVGGTGKTPMTEYLITILKDRYKVATLSRGYKRKTKGFGIANKETTALEIGDEPMQFHQKFPDVTVAVGEERLVAIPQLLHEKPDTQVIVLDDAFQHRSVNAGLNILLTDFRDLYTRDFLVPAGNLRDIRSSAKRAHIIIVTKCKSDLSNVERQKIIDELDPLSGQKIFFTEINYGTPYHLFSKASKPIAKETDVMLVCGIANPNPLKAYLTEQVHTYDMLRFADHHIFKMDDLHDIINQFEKMQSSDKIILTTEKDAVRLQKFEKELKDFPIYVLPIKHSFLFDDAENFNSNVINFINAYNKNKHGN
ncbi:tetraacyldisaccharide 4'-kinase [Ferruginibacter sp. SUN002]|uniref:tetraacyldisaccharide 4'-kinase n=1 Tax=Ferruginibacter sp. SUN002 TaxID=2937789 RepID=UPI003D35FB63